LRKILTKWKECESGHMQILLLDLATLEPVGTMVTNGAVSAVQVRPDGSVLVAGPVLNWQPIQQACAAIAVAVEDELPPVTGALGVYPKPLQPADLGGLRAGARDQQEA
jgi:hypothetical protein